MTLAEARSTPAVHAWLASPAIWPASFALLAAFVAACVAAPQAVAQAPASPAVVSPVSATAPRPQATKVNPKDGLTYVMIPPGRFIMGCSPGDIECFDEEKQVHEVTITSPFWMGRTDVTQEAYQRAIGQNPSHFKGANLPVDSVNWSEAQAYCQAMGARLPTEAEWEYAARGGDPSSRYGPLEEIAWHSGNSRSKTHGVAQKKANAFGLYDMLGNVWQWTADWYGAYAPAPASDPTGPGGGTGHTVRGGSWGDTARFQRESEREAVSPGNRYHVIGFRCVSAVGFVPEDRTLSARGGSQSVDVIFPTAARWTASSDADWITFTGPTSGVGNGTLHFQVAPNKGPARTATIAIADSALTVQQEADSVPGLSFIGSLPHIAAGQDWKTTFTLIDKDKASALVRLSLLGDSGSPLELALGFPQQGPGRALIGDSMDRTLSANASLIIDAASAQTGPLRMGSAQLSATGSVDGFAILHLVPGGQETIAPLETRNAGSYLLAFDNTGGVSLSVALANTSAQATNVGVVIRDDTGAPIGNGSLALESGSHSAFLLPTEYPVTANKRGTIEFDNGQGGRIGALGVRTTPLGTANTFATIPSLANIGTGGGSIPHFVAGNGWQTTFVLVNAGKSAAQVSLAFFDDSGSPLPLPIEFPQSGRGDAAVVSSVKQTLEAGATLLVRSAAPPTNPAPTIGSAQVSTDGNVGGFEILRHNPSGQEAVVPIESRNASAYLLAFDHSGGTTTGLAINSVSTRAVSIPVVVRDDTGAQIATDTISLVANGHLAFGAVEKYPATANIRGTIEFDPPAGAQIGVLGIRTLAGHTFTALPVLVK